MKAAALLVPLVLGGCSFVLGGRPETCGTYPKSGGPAVIATRDEELCEVVRLRVLRQLSSLTALQRDTLDSMLDRLPVWERRPDVESLIAMIRKDAGDDLANEVRRAVDDVAAKSARPLPADCADVQRCLVKGAVNGVRIALLYTHPTAPSPSDDKPLIDPGE